MEKEDDLLKKLLQADEEEQSASMQFTKNVMHTIETKNKWHEKPIIGKFGWILAAVIMTGLIIIGCLVNEKSSPIFPTFSISTYDMVATLKKLIIPSIGMGILLIFIALDELMRTRKKKLG